MRDDRSFSAWGPELHTTQREWRRARGETSGWSTSRPRTPHARRWRRPSRPSEAGAAEPPPATAPRSSRRTRCAPSPRRRSESSWIASLSTSLSAIFWVGW